MDEGKRREGRENQSEPFAAYIFTLRLVAVFLRCRSSGRLCCNGDAAPIVDGDDAKQHPFRKWKSKR